MEEAKKTASIEGSVESLARHQQTVFSLGVNCDAESVFNKDPKDANKYEIEGVKT